MKKVLLFLTIGTAFLGCSHLQMGMFLLRDNKTETDPHSISRGREEFVQYCARCHGENGDGRGLDAKALGTTPTNFRSSEFTKSAALIAAHTSYGKRQDMPAFVDLLPEETIWDIANYLHSIQALR